MCPKLASSTVLYFQFTSLTSQQLKKYQWWKRLNPYLEFRQVLVENKHPYLQIRNLCCGSGRLLFWSGSYLEVRILNRILNTKKNEYFKWFADFFISGIYKEIHTVIAWASFLWYQWACLGIVFCLCLDPRFVPLNSFSHHFSSPLSQPFDFSNPQDSLAFSGKFIYCSFEFKVKCDLLLFGHKFYE